MHPGSFNATSESSTASVCSPFRMGLDSQEYCATLRAFNLTSSSCSYCCRRDSRPFFDDFNSSELYWTRSRYSFCSVKLVIFENDPLSIHWRTAWTDLSKTVTLFIELMQNWLLRNMVSIYFHFFILFSIIAPRSDWWVSFVAEYIYNWRVWNIFNSQ